MITATIARAVYRVKQFWWAMRAEVPSEDWREAEERLSQEELVLFESMDAAAQRHSLEVYRALLAGGCDDNDALKAALLHDVGKRKPGLFYRTATVLLTALFSTSVERLAAPKPGSWRYGFYTYAHHAEIGAEMLAAAGSEPRVVHLVRAHHSAPGTDRWLNVLQAADEKN
jgi:putative nucleotidyltransferase with HDIG domain